MAASKPSTLTYSLATYVAAPLCWASLTACSAALIWSAGGCAQPAAKNHALRIATKTRRIFISAFPPDLGHTSDLHLMWLHPYTGISIDFAKAVPERRG